MAQVGTAAASQGLELCLGLGKVSASLRAGFFIFSYKAHRASGWVSRSLQDPFSKWFRLTDSLIDCLID